MVLKTMKREIAILEVAGRIGLKVRGKVARCFSHHPDRHPSLYFNPTMNRFKCYVCPDIGGSVIDLAMQALGLSISEAITYLENEFGCGVRRGQVESVAQRSKREDVSTALSLEERSQIYEAFLERAPLEKEGAGYLSGRGIEVDLARRRGTGFLRPEDYAHVYSHLERRFGRGLIKAAGLGRFYLFAKEGLSFVLFPYRLEGRTHLIKARCFLDKEEADARGVTRFIATGRSDFFFNHDLLESASLLYLCEGEIDTLTLLQRGYPAVGISGVNGFLPGWFSLLSGKEVVLSLDPDPAGRRATSYLSAEFEKRSIRHRRIELPEGVDINRFYMKERTGGSGATES